VRPRLWSLCSLVALVLAGGPGEPARAADLSRYTLRLDARGRVSTRSLAAVALEMWGVPVALPEALGRGMLDLGSPAARASLEGLGPLLRMAGITLWREPRALLIEVDRDQLRAAHDAVEAALTALLGGPSVRHGLRRLPESSPEGPPVVLVHGLDSAPDQLAGAARAIARRGYDVYLASYPNDRSILVSAGELGADLRALHAARGRRLALVTTSMGGLVVQAYLELDPAYRGEVARFIACAPPFAGSPLARYRGVLEVLETAADLVTVGWEGFFVFDGLGQAGLDLEPGSTTLARLQEGRRRAGVTYSILAGQADLVPPALLTLAKQALARLAARKPTAGSAVALELAREALRTVESLAAPAGDGAVALESTRLAGVRDHLVLPVHHLAFLAGDESDRPIPALTEVLARLPPAAHGQGARRPPF
jgi:pimeloyl-ACP methyl ester carboxylesterase